MTTTISPARRSFPGTPIGVTAVRRWLATILDPTDPVTLDAVLVIAELATNAVRHTASGERGGTFDVACFTQQRAVLIEVRDSGTPAAAPHQPPPTLTGTSGRGLAIVDALAASWGVTRTPPGRTVWAEIHPTPAAAAANRPAATREVS